MRNYVQPVAIFACVAVLHILSFLMGAGTYVLYFFLTK